MPLLDLWSSSRETVETMSLRQVLANAGDGRLLDGSEASNEFRTFIRKVPSETLRIFCETALQEPLQDGGLALQDLVNEVGRRLEFSVEFGRYRGTSKPVDIGFDGLWITPEGKAIVIEVKTTDAYRINLSTVAKYREQVIQSGKTDEETSILYVVGRADTGDLEAQIRGSRHAWDIRLISIDALLDLLEIKESTDEEQTLEKIRRCLEPIEYTKLDSIVDLIFTATKDAESGQSDEPSPDPQTSEPTGTRTQEQTPREIIEARRKQLVDAIAKEKNVSIVAKRKALFWSDDGHLRACCVVSKRYEHGTRTYWYALHEPWLDFLSGSKESYYVAGCVDQPIGFKLPYALISELVPKLNSTTLPNKRYWHIQINESNSGHYSLILHGGELRAIDRYKFDLE